MNISAVIYNEGNLDVENVIARFYDGDSITGEQIGDDINISKIPELQKRILVDNPAKLYGF